MYLEIYIIINSLQYIYQCNNNIKGYERIKRTSLCYVLIKTDSSCSLTTHPYAVNIPQGNCRNKFPTLIIMELRQRLMFCFVFSSLETNVYKVIISLEDNASASANHNIFSTVFMQKS